MHNLAHLAVEEHAYLNSAPSPTAHNFIARILLVRLFHSAPSPTALIFILRTLLQPLFVPLECDQSSANLFPFSLHLKALTII